MDGILETDERTELRRCVADFTDAQPTKLRAIIPPLHVSHIRTDAMPAMYAYNVVRYCEFSAWAEDPALIIKLLKKWDYLPLLLKAIDRLSNTTPPIYHKGNTVWNTCLVPLEIPFLGRQETRKAIERFSYELVSTINPAGVRVLVVNGPEKSGKTLTYNYVNYVNNIFANLNFISCYIDIKKQITSRFGPVELIESLLDQINPDWETQETLPILDNQQPARWMLELARILISQVNSMNQKKVNEGGIESNYFFILDRFDDSTVPRDTLDLIQILSAIATGAELVGENNDVIRLVLLGYQENIPNFRNRVVVDNIAPITQKDIEDYFKKFAAYKGKMLDDQTLQAFVDASGFATMPDEPDKNEKIATKVLQIVKVLDN